MVEQSKETGCFRNPFKPLKKWSALPDCIRQVCVSRDKSSANEEPDREGDAKANGEPVKIVEEEKVVA